MMLGVDDDIRPNIKEEKFLNPSGSRNRTMSMAFLVNDKTPMHGRQWLQVHCSRCCCRHGVNWIT